MLAENHPLNANDFLPDVCQLMSDVLLNRTASELDFFPPNCRGFAVECD